MSDCACKLDGSGGPCAHHFDLWVRPVVADLKAASDAYATARSLIASLLTSGRPATSLLWTLTKPERDLMFRIIDEVSES